MFLQNNRLTSETTLIYAGFYNQLGSYANRFNSRNVITKPSATNALIFRWKDHQHTCLHALMDFVHFNLSSINIPDFSPGIMFWRLNTRQPGTFRLRFAFINLSNPVFRVHTSINGCIRNVNFYCIFFIPTVRRRLRRISSYK